MVDEKLTCFAIELVTRSTSKVVGLGSLGKISEVFVSVASVVLGPRLFIFVWRESCHDWIFLIAPRYAQKIFPYKQTLSILL